MKLQNIHRYFHKLLGSSLHLNLPPKTCCFNMSKGPAPCSTALVAVLRLHTSSPGWLGDGIATLGPRINAIYMYTYTSTYMYICIYVYVYMYLIYTRKYMHLYLYLYMYMQIHMYMNESVNTVYINAYK